MRAFDYLEQVKVLDTLIMNKTAEQEQLRDMAYKITQANDGMPHGPDVSDKVGNAAISPMQRTSTTIWQTRLPYWWQHLRVYCKMSQKP